MKWLLPLMLVLGCGRGADIVSYNGFCSGYQPEATSNYVLPFAVGVSSNVDQGNCTQFTHGGVRRFSYDFNLPAGTQITAARHGTVVSVSGPTVKIRHVDGTVANYSQMENSTISVTVGATVTQGGAIGNIEDLGAGSHVHLEVNESAADGSQSIPLTFRNTRGHPHGLVEDETYTSVAFTPDAN